MTIEQWIEMIGQVETGGEADERDRLEAIGDAGRAGGYYQQHWEWRLDYWPPVFWEMLRVMDREAMRTFATAHAGLTARQLSSRYNLGHEASDPAYEAKCVKAATVLKIDIGELDKHVTG